MHALDKDLITQCKNNSREGFNALFKHFEKYIYSICYQYTNSKEDALDLTQEIFIKIYNGMSTFEEDRPIVPWIKKITINSCLNYLRDEKNSLNNISLNQTGTDSVISGPTDVEDSVISLDTQHIIEQSIHALPPEMKMAIILRHVHDMSYQDIGTAMTTPIGTIKTYLHRGRKLLQENLKKCGVYGRGSE